jgi:hypothetical protein
MGKSIYHKNYHNNNPSPQRLYKSVFSGLIGFLAKFKSGS